MILPLLITAAIAYVLGALPFGYWVARAKGVNILEVGSKNPGATNVKRVLGSGPGNLVFTLDVLKGVIATIFPLLLELGGPRGSTGYDLGGVIGVAAAVLGLRRRPPEAGVAGGHGRRAQHPRGLIVYQ